MNIDEDVKLKAIVCFEGELLALGVPVQNSVWMDLWSTAIAREVNLVNFPAEGACEIAPGNIIRIDVRFDIAYPLPDYLRIAYETAEEIAGLFTPMPTGMVQTIIGPAAGIIYPIVAPEFNHRWLRLGFSAPVAPMAQVNYTVRITGW